MPSMRLARLLIATIALALAAAFFSTGSLSNGDRASAAGPFFLNGVAEAALTSDLSPNDVHSFCRFRMTTAMSVASLRGMCYVVTKTAPGTPPVPPPPPPPYSALLPIVNLQVLGGTISQVDGSVTLTFSPSLCVPVDTQNDPDTDPDAGLTATLTTTAGKDGSMGNGNVVLNFDRGLVDANPFDCDQVDETASTAFAPTNLAMSHDSDIWATGMTAADGCSSWEELGTTAAMGGLRDPFNYWDFMDQYTGAPLAKDRIIAVGDIGAVVNRFGTMGVMTGDPTVVPGGPGGYHVSADRSGAIPGGMAWTLKPPDGIIAVGDIGAVVGQFGHSCTAAP